MKADIRERMNWILAAALVIAIMTAVMFAIGKKDHVAKINGEKISKDQLYEVLVSNYGADVLQSMIDEKVIEQEIKKAGIKVPQGDIDQELKDYKDDYGGEDAFKEALETSGMTMEDVEKNIESYLALKQLMESRVNITEDEMKAYFEENKDQFGQKEAVTASHILVEDKATAKKVINKLEKGEDFSDLAADYSKDEATSGTGGKLGSITKGEMVQEFEDAAFSMKAGEISDPVKTEYGYHVIKLEQKTKAKEAKYKEVKEDIHSILFETKMEEDYPVWLEEVKAKYDIDNVLE